MRLTRIEFNGYKRLLETTCNVDAPLVALVGPNESGKTSVLQALEWLTDGSTKLASERVNRGIGLAATGVARPAVSDALVAAEYVLDEADKALLEDLDLATQPSLFWFGKTIDGECRYRFTPEPERSSGTRGNVAKSLQASSVSGAHGDAGLSDDVDLLTKLADSGAEWDDAAHQAAAHVIAWLDGEEHSSAAIPARTRQTDERLAGELRTWDQQMQESEPSKRCWETLHQRVPKFLLFGQDDRELADKYSLTFSSQQSGQTVKETPHSDVSNPPSALVNLLALAGTTMSDIFRTVRSGDSARVRQLQRKANRNLSDGLSPYWRQAKVAAEINIDGQTLQIHVTEDDGDRTSRFTERSDGFRTFATLLVYLARNKSKNPPVLLIDEAETHLHYDAQADLISYLLNLKVRTIYTTHSPGCLPPDLGTGIRVVRPKTDGTSELRNDFWTGEQVGLTPLLYAMGAGVAALSRFRAAVFTEGPSEMILLPSLLRAATGRENLPYQVVPGLATLRADQIGEANHTAVRVAYLVDGDAGGDVLRKDLIAAGIHASQVTQLSRGQAIEDLVHPEVYLDAVNAILVDSGRSAEKLDPVAVAAHATTAGVPISVAVETFLAKSPPGKTIVAARLVQDPTALRLAPSARAMLRQLDRKWRKTLELPLD